MKEKTLKTTMHYQLNEVYFCSRDSGLADAGREQLKSYYIKLPKPGTNPRGVEITKKALLSLVEDNDPRKIEINWQRKEIEFNPYKRRVDL
ncbi:MAG: ThaI family type II restriction endonuclease [Thermoplasmata archaeon]